MNSFIGKTVKHITQKANYFEIVFTDETWIEITTDDEPMEYETEESA